MMERSEMPAAAALVASPEQPTAGAILGSRTRTPYSESSQRSVNPEQFRPSCVNVVSRIRLRRPPKIDTGVRERSRTDGETLRSFDLALTVYDRLSHVLMPVKGWSAEG